MISAWYLLTLIPAVWVGFFFASLLFAAKEDEKSGWIECKRRLPEVVTYPDESVNSVLVYQKDGWECGSDFQVVSTPWLNGKYAKGITHWMPLPNPPVGNEEDKK
jgi:hypothetical protein